MQAVVMAAEEELLIARWLQILFGILLGALTLFCGYALVHSFLSFGPTNSPVGPAIMLGLLLACLWLLTKCARMILGRPIDGGLFSATGLRIMAWVVLLLPVVGLGIAIIQGNFKSILRDVPRAIIYVFIFLGWRSLASSRENSRGVALDPADPLFARAVRMARDSINVLRSLAVSSDTEVAVKYAFTTDRGAVEYVWGKLLQIGDENMRVTLDTPPVEHDAKVPESLSVPLNKLQDWQATFENGEIRGGFTTQAMIAILRRDGKPVPRHIASMENHFVDVLGTS